jgi:hypothetical protein
LGRELPLLLDTGERLLRIQCKTGPVRNGAVHFRAQSVRCNTKQVFIRDYVGDVDHLAVYCPDKRGVYVVPCDETTRTQVTLRLEPAANGQNRRIR